MAERLRQRRAELERLDRELAQVRHQRDSLTFTRPHSEGFRALGAPTLRAEGVELLTERLRAHLRQLLRGVHPDKIGDRDGPAVAALASAELASGLAALDDGLELLHQHVVEKCNEPEPPYAVPNDAHAERSSQQRTPWQALRSELLVARRG